MTTRQAAQARLRRVRTPGTQTGEVLSTQETHALHDGMAARLTAIEVIHTDAHLLTALMDSLPDNIYFKDLDSRFIRVSRAMARYLGLDDPKDAIGKSDFDFFDAVHAQAAFDDEQEVIQTGRPVVGKDERERHPNGEIRWVSTTKLPLRDAGGQVVGTFGISRDITARKLAEDRLYQQAYFDPLTHLPNRSLLLSRLARCMESVQPGMDGQHCVLFIDVDRFKGINDSLGHNVGDKLLVELARRLETCVRPGDLVARLGGDEFTVLLEKVWTIQDAEKVVERIHGAMKAPFFIDGSELYCSVSIGIALSNKIYNRGEDLLRDAATAMYQAKSSGRARHVVFLTGMHDRARSLLRLENDLRRAIDRREFLLHYQPIVDTRTWKISGFEALLRWQHPTRGRVHPDEFVPLAEETGLICTIGLWSLEQACLQLRRWHDVAALGPQTPRISVNISARQFAQPDLLAQIQAVLDETSAPASKLVLEVTESALMANITEAAHVIERIRQMGIHVCIDDFGMGYSSFGQMERLAIDGFKIDRSFILRMATSEKTAEIVRTMITLAQNLNVNITAEGVETREQLAMLHDMGGHLVQGFLFSRAVSASAADILLKQPLPSHWHP